MKSKGLQEYLKVIDVEPHPQATDIIHQINVDKITNKQVHWFLNLNHEEFDGMDHLDANVLRSYFGDYSPSEKGYKTQGS